MLRYRKLQFLSIFVLGAVCLADNLTYMRVERPVIERRLRPVPATDKDRVEALRAQFAAAGCNPNLIKIQAIPNEEVPNVVCVVPGPDPGAIVVGTRLESKAKGNGAEAVDWGGPVMLPLLAESLNSAIHHQAFILVAFAGKDRGTAGARYFLEHLSDDERAQIQAMIEVEKVGRTTPVYGLPGPDATKLATTSERTRGMVQGAAPTTLVKVLPLAAASLRLPNAPRQDNEVDTAAAKIFEDGGIPSIVIHSPGYTTLNPPGSFDQVRMARTDLDPEMYAETYNLTCVYLLYLDKVYYLAHGKAAEDRLAKESAKANKVPPASATTFSNEIESSSNPKITAPAGVATPASASHSAQSQPVAEGNPSNPIFRTTTRLVQVDVVATDKQGRPVLGLTESDFTILQDGKAQKIHVFEPHRGDIASGDSTAAPNEPKLPPNTYSNHPNDATADSWTIVLFDVLNTPPTDQAYARKQLLEMLTTIPRGNPVALYLLTNRLVMLQGFTDDPKKLLEAAEELKPGRSHVLTTEAERQRWEGQITNATSELTANAPSGATNNNDLINQLNSGRQQQLHDVETFQIADRANFTLAALEALSRAVSGYPGRKNLIWLSAGFPIQILADPTQQSQPWRNSKNFQDAMAMAGGLLAKSRIAVYPTDVRGLQGRGVDVSVSSSESGEWTEAQNSQNYGNLIGQQTATFADERKTMMEVAERTGGEAFLGTNDLKRAMQRSLEDGAIYYTLAYTPDNVDPESAFHRIQVKVDQPDVKLAYRRGYYSTPQKPVADEVGVAALKGALQPGMPPSTAVFFTAKVIPPDAENKDARIAYVVNPNTVTFTDIANNKKRVVLDCLAIAYDTVGKEVAHASDTLDGTINESAYETVLTHGVPAQQQISLRPGSYNLRLGVMDRVSQQIGTLDVPLVVPETAQTAKK